MLVDLEVFRHKPSDRAAVAIRDRNSHRYQIHIHSKRLFCAVFLRRLFRVSIILWESIPLPLACSAVPESRAPFIVSFPRKPESSLESGSSWIPLSRE